MTDDVQEIKARLDIGQLIGETVQLKKAGRNLKGLCPFHNEKSPSFMVTPDRGAYRCFGCGESGDIFAFVMKRESLDFSEALQMLATRAGLTLKGHDPKASQQKRRGFEVLEQTVHYFQAALQHDAGKAARDYLASRGISEDTVKKFRIGYAPDSFEALPKALHSKKFTDQEMQDAGVAGRGSRGVYARFRHRLMIPIADSSGTVRGFTGRILDDSAKEAKYINTSETALFKKGRLVFALDLAKQAIITADAAVLVEGQMDVIASHQAGVANVVAASGTALTEEQLKQIARYSHTVIMALDNDAAGLKALMKALELSQEISIELKVADLGEAKDPDELIQQDVAAWQSTLDNALPVIEYLMAKALEGEQRPYDRPAIQRVLTAVLPAIKFRPDIDQDYYAEQLSVALGVTKASITKQLKELSQNPPPAPRPTAEPAPATPPRPTTPEDAVTERILGLALLNDPLRGKLATTDARLFPEEYRNLVTAAEIGYDEQTLSDTDRALLGVCALAAAEYEMMTDRERAAEFDRLLARIKLLWGKRHQPKLLAAIKRAEKSGDTESRNRLVSEYTSLTKRISDA